MTSQGGANALTLCYSAVLYNSSYLGPAYYSAFKDYRYSFVISQHQNICNNNLVKQHTSRLFVSGALKVAVIKVSLTYAACRCRGWLHLSKVLKQWREGGERTL